MSKEVFVRSCYLYVGLLILLVNFSLSSSQGYNYYANQQRNYYAQRAAQAQRTQTQQIQAHRIQAQRTAAQRIAAQNHYYQQSYKSSTTTQRPYKISRADSQNAKFLGSQNQESVGSERTFRKKAKKLFGAGYGFGYGAGYGAGAGVNNGCYFRNSNQPKSEGRVFWDFNVYNVYPNRGCHGAYPGGYPLGFGGGLSDPFYGGRPVRGLFQNWLGLFLPGGALSGINRPYQSPTQSQQSISQTDSVDYDASLGSTGSDTDSSSIDSVSSDEATGGSNNLVPNNVGMGNLTPGQLVSGVAHTVNNVIQTLSSSPVYG